MTIDEFRTHDSFPTQWRKELEENRLLQIVLQVLEDNAPWHFKLESDNQGDLSKTRAGLELGTTKGYAMYGDRLKLLAIRKLKREEPGISTYQKPVDPNQIQPQQ